VRTGLRRAAPTHAGQVLHGPDEPVDPGRHARQCFDVVLVDQLRLARTQCAVLPARQFTADTPVHGGPM